MAGYPANYVPHIPPSHPLKECASCGEKKEPLSGVEMRGQWHCGKCWTKFLNKR